MCGLRAPVMLQQIDFPACSVARGCAQDLNLLILFTIDRHFLVGRSKKIGLTTRLAYIPLSTRSRNCPKIVGCAITRWLKAPPLIEEL
jgi:hypothetical protein